eukprot:366502-Chlamydomonas_euryale.AAC.2
MSAPLLDNLHTSLTSRDAGKNRAPPVPGAARCGLPAPRTRDSTRLGVAMDVHDAPCCWSFKGS